MENINAESGFWINEPKKFTVSNEKIIIITEEKTDFWQRTHYGFRNDNAPAFLFSTDKETFSFVVKSAFDSKELYDQCGLIIYQNSDNWFKASIEYENGIYQRLGSVVTNNGYSDWATTDIDADINEMYYRLSRKGKDFCLENSIDGVSFKQMRIFHLFEAENEVNIGIYACSPSNSSFEAVFTEIGLYESIWK
ncbi:DUF1349 domain-containing protein [Sebaldella sp. S0638]|uniref:DUF1349 domain-containing protein n=1 Tax=Sebaldella sp. S0638 TaxID=2957809 RepID=UPI0020A1230B|nr:DUF1349 domain-containing protein [Sebaldella sp. S0638]MCP1223205.1 DUF1349 domain-containing protein [Sebaldella sp. S0638]